MSALKRALDVTCGCALIAVLAPLGLGCAFAILATSMGPVFFRQPRVGMRGVAFTLNKFRTMRCLPVDDTARQFQPGDDSRVTRVGAFLRRSKLDELPQLWNVVRGDMSLVGPRPEVARWTQIYPDTWEIVHSVRPGLTDLASIEYRNEESLLAMADDPDAMYRDVILPRKLQLAVQYVNDRSLALDLKILARTVWEVLAR